MQISLIKRHQARVMPPFAILQLPKRFIGLYEYVEYFRLCVPLGIDRVLNFVRRLMFHISFITLGHIDGKSKILNENKIPFSVEFLYQDRGHWTDEIHLKFSTLNE